MRFVSRLKSGVGLLLVGSFALTACSWSQPSEATSEVSSSGATTDASAAAIVKVRRGGVPLRWTLDGRVVTGSVVSLSPHQGLNLDRSHRVGDVALGDSVGRLVVSQRPGRSAGEKAILLRQEREVKAPVAGELTGDGDIVGAGLDATAELTAIQLLRFISDSFSGTATFEALGGKETLPCMWIWAVPVRASSNETEGVAEVHCRLPRGVETVAGLKATLTITNVPDEDALVVPTRFISLDPETGERFVEVDSGGSTRRAVVVAGFSNGVIREVRGAIEEGDVLVAPKGLSD